MNIITIDRESNWYSGRLKEIFDPPEILYCLGNVGLLNETKLVAVVGSREISEYGKTMVERIVLGLVKAGVVIVSGMAFGVDVYAHKICLDCGGKTVAILASGVDVCSPAGNKMIYDRILKEGSLVVSEKRPGGYPKPEDFLRRNRIVAGMIDAVLVIEGGENSGSVNTARVAVEIGREVGAVPGRVGDENSKATNYLIKNGAKLIESAEDVLSLLS